MSTAPSGTAVSGAQRPAPLLSVRRLTKDFGGLRAVADFRLELA